MTIAPRYMLDTNAVTLFVRDPSVSLEARLAAMPQADVCVSAITAGELRYGLARRPRAERLARAVESLLVRLVTLPWDDIVAARYGHLRAALVSAGTPLAPLDTLIAAHALATGAVLVTNDRAFAHVPGLAIEDWQTS
jgi:tRNA(fMet)-specific endonuclease VapC